MVSVQTVYRHKPGIIQRYVAFRVKKLSNCLSGKIFKPFFLDQREKLSIRDQMEFVERFHRIQVL